MQYFQKNQPGHEINCYVYARMTPTSMLAEGHDIEEAGKLIEWGGSLRLAGYVSHEDSTTKLPFSVRLRLDALVCVAHHGNEQVEQHYHRHHQIDSKDKMSQGRNGV